MKSNAVFKVQTVLGQTAEIRDRLIILGGDAARGACTHPLRLIEVHFGSTWYRYLTSVLDPTILPARMVADLYRRHWRIEEAFLTVKRLLNLAYLWTGSLNGILSSSKSGPPGRSSPCWLTWVTPWPKNSCYPSTAFRWRWFSGAYTTSPKLTIAAKPPRQSNIWRQPRTEIWAWSNASARSHRLLHPIYPKPISRHQSLKF